MRYSHEVKAEQDGVVIVGIRENNLVLELGAHPVLPLNRFKVRKLIRPPLADPGNDGHAVVRSITLVLELGNFLC